MAHLSPFTTEPIGFLGQKVQVPTDNVFAREEVLFLFKRMLEAIDKTLLTRRQKKSVFWWSVSSADLASALIQEFPTFWMEQKMDAVVT